MAYKLKSAFRPSERKRRDIEEVELNLTPIMNLVVVLIPLLLQAMVLSKIGRIDYEPPPLMVAEESDEGGGGDGGGGGPVLLNLVVNVIDTSLQVSIYGATEGNNYWNISLTPEGFYDFGRLQEVLYEIKTKEVGEPERTEKSKDPKTGVEAIKEIYKFEDASIVRIAAGPQLSYQNLVALLDATRSIMISDTEKWLFPQPVLGQIQSALVAVN